MIENFLVGSDIEAFITNPDSILESAENLLKGTKENPTVVSGGRTYSIDNILAEYTINPVTSRERFIEEIITMRDHVQNLLPKGYSLEFSPSRNDTEHLLFTENALTMGCEPSFCVHTASIIETPDGASTILRSSGLHIHLSWPTCDNVNNIEEIEKFIRACDLFIGLPMLFVEPASERRKIYGQAGSFRFKKYPNGWEGVEYRVLSGYSQSDRVYLGLIWDYLMTAIEFTNSKEEIDSQDLPLIREAINTCDLKIAKEIYDKYSRKEQRSNG